MMWLKSSFIVYFPLNVVYSVEFNLIAYEDHCSFVDYIDCTTLYQFPGIYVSKTHFSIHEFISCFLRHISYDSGWGLKYHVFESIELYYFNIKIAYGVNFLIPSRSIPQLRWIPNHCSHYFRSSWIMFRSRSSDPKIILLRLPQNII